MTLAAGVGRIKKQAGFISGLFFIFRLKYELTAK